jgi:glycine/D-amino acid oxidase-like deaminating enzyme
VRACIVGGGLAGSLLAWRLVRATTGWEIDLVPGHRRHADATAASGGAVRAYEPRPEQRRLAIASLVELLASPTLRRWAGYQEVGSVYLRLSGDGLGPAVADIELALPGSVELVPASELGRRGWADLHADGAAVLERQAGYTSPGRLRDAAMADAVSGERVSIVDGAVGAIAAGDRGAVSVVVTGRAREYDTVVVAAGAWTPALLGSSGLPAAGFRTKSIQYAVHPVDGWCPPPFVDEVTGLYGRPTVDGGLLLGLPADQWDVDPDRPPTTGVLADTAARFARARFPALRIAPATLRVGSADCYTEPPGLALRSVLDSEHRLFTFSGGAGGSVKTALAASHRAAIQLAETGAPTGPSRTPVGRRKGRP